MGATARRMFEDEKAAVLQQIDAECEKYKGQALPIPARGVKARYPLISFLYKDQTFSSSTVRNNSVHGRSADYSPPIRLSY
jgi:hypothetical protein